MCERFPVTECFTAGFLVDFCLGHTRRLPLGCYFGIRVCDNHFGSVYGKKEVPHLYVSALCLPFTHINRIWFPSLCGTAPVHVPVGLDKTGNIRGLLPLSSCCGHMRFQTTLQSPEWQFCLIHRLNTPSAGHTAFYGTSKSS